MIDNLNTANIAKKPAKTANTPAKERTCYSVEELMIMLDVCRNTLMKLIRRNEFPCYKICGVYYIPKKSFDEWLDS